MTNHPDLYVSVRRCRDTKQLEIGIKDVIEKLSLRAGETVLDAGYGSGIFLSEIINRTQVEAIGIDFSTSHIRFAKEKFARIGFLVASVEELPFKPFYSSKVLSYSVIHCLDTWERALDELMRVSKPGGKILIRDVLSRHHKYRMYLDSVIGLLSAVGNFEKLKENGTTLKRVLIQHYITEYNGG